MSEENETLGSYLRRERKKREISLEQIAYATRISLKMLAALEEDTHQLLPAEPFVRGYLQAYAKYAKLDPKDVLLRYQHHLAITPVPVIEATKESQVFAQEKQKDHRRLIITIVSFAFILAGYGAYLWFKSKIDEDQAKQIRLTPILRNASVKKEETSASPTQAMSLAQTTNKAKNSSPPPLLSAIETAKAKLRAASNALIKKTEEKIEAVTPPKPTVVTTVTTADEVSEPGLTSALNEIIDPIGYDLKFNLRLTAKENVWIRFQTDANEIKDLILRRNRTIFIRANKVIRLFSGNLSGLSSEFNGEALEKMTGEGRKRSVVLPFSEIPKIPLPLFPENIGTAQENSSLQNRSRPAPPSDSTETL